MDSLHLSSCIFWIYWLTKNPRSSIGLEIRPHKNAFTVFRALLVYVGCDSPLHVVMVVLHTFSILKQPNGYYYLQQAVTLNPSSSNLTIILPKAIGQRRGGKIRDGIFTLLGSPGFDSKESIPPAYVAWRAGTITLFLIGSYSENLLCLVRFGTNTKNLRMSKYL